MNVTRTEPVSAKLTMKLRATTGYEADCVATVSPEQWGDVTAVSNGKLTTLEKQLASALREAKDLLELKGIDINDTADYGNGRADDIVIRISAALDAAEKRV